jgi:hypothetical protein
MTQPKVSLPVYAVGNGEGNMPIFSVGEKPKDEQAVLVTKENRNYWLNRSNIGGKDAQIVLYISDTPMEARTSANFLRTHYSWDAQVTYNRLPCGYGATLLAQPPERGEEVKPVEVEVLDYRQSGDEIEIVGSWELTEAELAELDQPDALKAVGDAIGAHMGQAVAQIGNPDATKAAQNVIEREALGAEVSFIRFDVDDALNSCYNVRPGSAQLSKEERDILQTAIVQAAEYFTAGDDALAAVDDIRSALTSMDEEDLSEKLWEIGRGEEQPRP